MAGLCAPQSLCQQELVCFFIRSHVYQAQTCYVAENDIELMIFLSLPPETWDSRCEPLHLAYVALEMEPGAS